MILNDEQEKKLFVCFAGPIAQLVMCLAADTCLTTDPSRGCKFTAGGVLYFRED